jgi:hypothetical protein
MPILGKKLALLVFLAAGGLGACTNTNTNANTRAATTWNNPNVTQAQAGIDASECRRYSMSQAQLQTMPGPSSSRIPGAEPSMPTTSSAMDQQRAFERCLMERGYQPVRG